MAAIPIELDKLFAAAPAKTAAAESSLEQADSFRRHLEPRRPANESSLATASQASPSADNSHSSDNKAANGSAKPSERKSESPNGADDDQLVANNDGSGTAVVAPVVANQPVVDARHANEATAELKANAESVVVSGEQAGAGPSANGVAIAAATVAGNAATKIKSLAPAKIGGDETASSVAHKTGAAAAQTGGVAASVVAVTAANVTVESVKALDDNQTKTVAGQARAVKASPEKGKAAARAKSGGDGADKPGEHAATQAAGDLKSPSPNDEAPQEHSRGDARSLPHGSDVSNNEPATKAHAPDPTSNTRDTTTESVAADQSAARDATGNSASPQNSPTPPNVTDVAATIRLPSHLVSRGAERSASGVHLTDVEQAKFLQRVARAFQAAQERDGEVRLRLSPPELGALRLEIKIHEGALTARLEAESPAAKSLLLDNLPVLRERLAEQGIRIEHFDVDLLDRQTGGSPQQSPHGHERETQPSPLPPRFVRETNESETNELAPRPSIRRLGDGRLNVIV